MIETCRTPTSLDSKKENNFNSTIKVDYQELTNSPLIINK
jgi:hypothetical protein